MKNTLEVQHLVKTFGGLSAVNHCNFSIQENDIVALIGPNGAGKTTMFDLITGLLVPTSGEIFFQGKSLSGVETHERAKLGIARTFQAIRIFPELSALENVLLAIAGYNDSVFASFGRNRHLRALSEQAHELLRTVHLDEKARHRAGDLSYGQQKLLEIVRAIATGADLFLFDEPAAGVNRTLLHTIVGLIKKLKSEGKTLLIVEHDMGFVMEISERIIVMDYGKEIADGTPAEIQNNPKVLEAYLGVKHS